MTPARNVKTHLVLVGAGHANLGVLRSFAARPAQGLDITVVVDREASTYSGMVPGVLAGDHGIEEATIHVPPLAAAAGAKVLLDAAVSIDADARTLLLAGGSRLEWEVASIDIGSAAAGLDLPGVREHAIATRPLGDFVGRVDAALRLFSAGGRRPDAGPVEDIAPSAPTPSIVVVGGGTAGVELAFTLEARARHLDARVCLVTGASGAMPGAAPRVLATVMAEAARRGIAVHAGADVVVVEKGAVRLADGGRLVADIVVWATGAAAPPLPAASGLPLDSRGFLRVTPTLEVPGHAGLFAAGDCCTPDHAAWTPKAGVYAVRAGEVLERNLRSFVEGRPLEEWSPQRDFLSLVNLGDRRAIATKRGWVFTGRAAWWLKRAIDRRFVTRHRRTGTGPATPR